MAELLVELEQKIPNVREVMLASLKNVRPTHLLDPTLSSSRNEVAEAPVAACGPVEEPLISIDG